MRRPRTARNRRLVLESLEARWVQSTTPLTSPASDPEKVLATLQAFTQHYPSRVGNPQYDPAFDLNHNGQIGQDDGKILLHRLGPISRPVPLNLRISLAPADIARGPVPKNSGGVTHKREVSVVGRTTPGALVFTGTGTIDVTLRGPAYVADARGNFRIPLKLVDGINQFNVEAVDASGRQNFRAYPIYWLGFAAYEAAHPRRS
ncbi:MAG: hypothetical protein U0794_02130 [Isosphaeraceae bacterium]